MKTNETMDVVKLSMDFEKMSVLSTRIVNALEDADIDLFAAFIGSTVDLFAHRHNLTSGDVIDMYDALKECAKLVHAELGV